MKHNIDPIQFAKWFIHKRRKKLVNNNDEKASWFASELMSELCHIEPFQTESPLIKEFLSDMEKEMIDETLSNR